MANYSLACLHLIAGFRLYRSIIASLHTSASSLILPNILHAASVASSRSVRFLSAAELFHGQQKDTLAHICVPEYTWGGKTNNSGDTQLTSNPERCILLIAVPDS
jgi:hypothetical protein